MRALPPIAEEFEGCVFPDARLSQRAKKIATQLEPDPKLSFPRASASEGELEGLYRFLENDRISLQTILGGHIKKAVSRARAAKRVLAIHDTTAFSFEGEREGMGIVDRTQSGFYAHACLAVSAEGLREPLGLLAFDTWTRETKKGKRTTSARRKETGLESQRWLQQSIDVDAQFADGTEVVHVEDREGDIFDSLATRAMAGMHFIVRACSNRVVLDDEDEKENVLEHARRLPRICERDIHLSARRGKFAKRPKAQHRDRNERETTVELRAGPICIRGPRRGGLDKQLELNAVYVGERHPPDGEEKVEWLLFTTEPISTASEVEWVVDSYRTRWLIEEYFKALKTGCGYEERQLESLDALLNALGIFAIIAWRLLVLRFIQRTATDGPAEMVATEAEIAVLIAKKRLQRGATAQDFLMALARFGGHLKRNGPPGLLILWRALRSLETLAEGWLLARRSDQS